MLILYKIDRPECKERGKKIDMEKKKEDGRFCMSTVFWPKWPSVHRELGPCSSVCITLTPSVKVRLIYKKPKTSSWSPWPDPASK